MLNCLLLNKVKNYKVTLPFENSHVECLGPNECRKSSALRWRQNSCSDVDDRTSWCGSSKGRVADGGTLGIAANKC